jgi:copper(I)-binding protein
MITRVLAAALLAATIGGTAASAHDYKAGTLAIHHPWSRATPPGAAVGGGFVTIKNEGTAPDRLVGASAEGAGRVEIHEMATVDGVMTMRPVKDGIVVGPGATVELKPGGYHMMFMDLKGPLKQGERVKGTLVFEKAGTVPVEFAVEAIGAKPAAEDHSAHTQ